MNDFHFECFACHKSSPLAFLFLSSLLAQDYHPKYPHRRGKMRLLCAIKTCPACYSAFRLAENLHGQFIPIDYRMYTGKTTETGEPIYKENVQFYVQVIPVEVWAEASDLEIVRSTINV